MIDGPAAVAEALRDYFLANADCGDNAANDELVAALLRRIRTQQATGMVITDVHNTANPERDRPGDTPSARKHR